MKSGRNLPRGDASSSWKASGIEARVFWEKSQTFSRLSAIYAFDQNVDVTVSCLYHPDQVFVRLEWISLGTLGFIADLVEPSRKTTIDDCGKLR